MQRPYIITINNLSKVYTEKYSNIQYKALDNINLNIEEGDFTAIAGPSGSGKTTLLNIIGALDKPTSGEVMIENTPLSTLTATESAQLRLKNIGFVFQAYNLIPTLNSLENAEYVALLQGVPQNRRRNEILQILKELRLDNLANRKPSELSAGQQQRVAVVRAILGRPKIVLADEPTANLDSKTGAELIELMKTMSQNLGITFIFATHDKMVMEKAKTLIQLHDGKII
ncbi:MAG: ABC transporter ATP-binding protein [Candidatus Omnitrophica bacterium]|nr:ABC transporter ATP-binding protein [Candidatus Omnitrophota bacterium]